MISESGEKAAKLFQKKVKVKYSKQTESGECFRVTVLYHGMKQIVQIVSNIPTPSMFLPDDFKSYIKISLGFKHISIPTVPVGYKLKVYLPLIFKSLRARFDITEELFEECFLGEPLPSKRLENYYKSTNQIFTLKFLKSHDISPFISTLRPYYEHVVINKNVTYLPKYVGLFRIRKEKKNTYVLITKNSSHMPDLETIKKHLYIISNRDSTYTVANDVYLGFESDEQKREIAINRLKKDIEFLSARSVRKLSVYAKIGKPLTNTASESTTPEPRVDVVTTGDELRDTHLKNSRSEELHIMIQDYSSDTGSPKAVSQKLNRSASIREPSDEHPKNSKRLNVEKCVQFLTDKLFFTTPV